MDVFVVVADVVVAAVFVAAAVVVARTSSFFEGLLFLVDDTFFGKNILRKRLFSFWTNP